MQAFKAFIVSLVFLFALWLLLAGSTSRQEMLVGGAVALLLALLFRRRLAVLGDVRLTPRALWHAFLYLWVFLWALLRSNLDVALRVVNPRLPIHPGIVRVHTRLRSRLGRLALANSITLTPGTLTVETRDDTFYIHWIDVTATDVEESTRRIVSAFEKHLEVIFG